MSILESIKYLLGIPKEHTAFDQQLIIHINSVFAVLSQLGPGGYVITGANEKWEDYLSLNDGLHLEDVKSYMYLKVRMLFDPPSHGAVIDAFKDMIKEYEWRFTVEMDEEDETE